MKKFGLAIDVGTTNVSACLVDLYSNKELARKIALNSQRVCGEDVISRINFAITKKDGLEKLNKKITGTINSLIDSLIRESGIEKDAIVKLVIVGNTVMNHILLGVSLRSLAFAPYKANLIEPVILKAKDTNFNLNKNAEVKFGTNIGGFVGSDALSMILFTKIHNSDFIKLAIDIGTNGEIILGKRNRILALSTAAGPAFEAQGKGICGSEFIDIAARLLRAGKIDKTGRLEGKKFNLTKKIFITQKDIRRFQLAKGAIRAGINILLAKAGIKENKISKIFIAGTFGKKINIKNAIDTGLIPKIDKDKIKVVGNAALEGAKMLLDDGLFDYSVILAKSVRHIKLFGKKTFKEEFAKAMSFA